LEDISLTIHPGEMVALVGPTGRASRRYFVCCWDLKRLLSAVWFTMTRLIEIKYSSAAGADWRRITNGLLFAGTIFENIAGSRPLTRKQPGSCVAGRLAVDIEAMSMGMHTLISEGGKTLSVGQRQRLMIARALRANHRSYF